MKRVLAVGSGAIAGSLNEVLSAAAGYQVVPLLAPVRFRELAGVMASGFDIFHFSGHGTQRGHLSINAEVLPAQALAIAMRRGGVRLAVLDACHSVVAGIAAHQVGVPWVVAWYGVVDAQSMQDFCETFYRSLSLGASIASAFHTACSALELVRRREDEGRPILLAPVRDEQAWRVACVASFMALVSIAIATASLVAMAVP